MFERRSDGYVFLSVYSHSLKANADDVVGLCFQGGPGIRGARGDRGEPGVTVCKMHLISKIIYSSSKPPARKRPRILSMHVASFMQLSHLVPAGGTKKPLGS